MNSLAPMPTSEPAEAVRRLPLWRDFYTRTKQAGGFGFGQFFTVAQLEAELGCVLNTAEFAFAVAALRKTLRRDGKNFTSRGQRLEGYIIAAPETNHREMQRLQSAAITAMREGVILGTSTPTGLLSAEEQRKHEAVLEKMANRLALLNRRALPDKRQPETLKA